MQWATAVHPRNTEIALTGSAIHNAWTAQWPRLETVLSKGICTGSWYGTRSCPHSLRNNGARCKMQAACASEPWQTEAGQVTQRNHTQAPVSRRTVLRTVHSQRTSGRAAWSTSGHVWKVTCYGSHPHSPNSWRNTCVGHSQGWKWQRTAGQHEPETWRQRAYDVAWKCRGRCRSSAWTFVKAKSCELCCKHTCWAMVSRVEIAAQFGSMLGLVGGLPAICVFYCCNCTWYD